MPFITAGDADLAATARLIEEFARRARSPPPNGPVSGELRIADMRILSPQ
jgi:hypothetical protein